MAVHGTDREFQRLRDYVHTEMMVLSERCAKLQDELAAMQRRLEAAERMTSQALTELLPPR